MSTETESNPALPASTGSVDWRSIADDLASALRRLDALYLSEQDAAAPTNRPEWLRRPLQRYHCALGDTPNPPLAEAAGSASAWMRAVWLESDRIHFASLMVFWNWYNAMSKLEAAGFVMRRGGTL